MIDRTIRVERLWSWRTFFFQWEWLLVLIFIAVNIVNSTLSPYYFTVDTFLGTPMTFLDKAFLVLPMTMVIILGNIDISVGSTVALSAVVMAVAFNAGLPMPLAVVLCLVVATTCGLINGILMTRFKELSVRHRDAGHDDHLSGHRVRHPAGPGLGEVPHVVFVPRLGLRGQGAARPHRLRASAPWSSGCSCTRRASAARSTAWETTSPPPATRA